MKIIVFIDKDGNQTGDYAQFMELKILESSEPSLQTIIDHAIANDNKPKKTIVLTDDEYKDLNANADKWLVYLAWKKAKNTYEAGKNFYVEDSEE